MRAPKNFWLFIAIGVIDLIAGLGLCVVVGTSHSWALALLMGAGFVFSANLMFYLALSKLG